MSQNQHRGLFLTAKAKVNFKALCREVLAKVKLDYQEKPLNDFGGWPSHKHEGFPIYLRSIDCFLSRPGYLEGSDYFTATIKKHTLPNRTLSSEDLQSVKILCAREILKSNPDELEYEEQLQAALEDEERAAAVIAAISSALSNPKVLSKLSEIFQGNKEPV